MTTDERKTMNTPEPLTEQEIPGALRMIDAGNALSAFVENDLEDRGLIIQSDLPYATLTAAGRALVYPAP